MKLRYVLCAAASIILAPVAASEPITFVVKGSGPDGSTYSGLVTLTEFAPGGPIATEAFKVTWKIGSDTTEGIAIVNKDDSKMLSISYTYGNALGVATMKEDGTGITGTWWLQGMTGIGKETWTTP